MGPGTLLAKIDIKSPYCITPVHPVDRHLMGMNWKGALPLDDYITAEQQAQTNFIRTARLSPACLTCWEYPWHLRNMKALKPAWSSCDLSWTLYMKGEIRLSEEKLQWLETLLQSSEGKKSCTKHKLQPQSYTTRLHKVNDCASKTSKAMAPYLDQCVL